jgi:ATP-dependent Clp protease ATP-binding subunit ClpC
VVVLAQEEARTLRHDHIGSEHLLLGFLRECETSSGSLALGRTLEEARTATKSLFPSVKGASPPRLPFTSHAIYALEQALDFRRLRPRPGLMVTEVT